MTLLIFKDDDAFVQLGEGRFRFDSIPAGAEHTLEVPVRVRSSYQVAGRERVFDADSVVLQIRAAEDFDAADGRYGVGVFQSLTVPVGSPLEAGSIVQPSVSVVSQERIADDQLSLTLQVEDDDPAFIAVFRDEEKVAMITASELVDGQTTITIPLNDGLSEIRVLAEDQAETAGFTVIRSWPADPDRIAVQRDVTE